MRLDPLAFEHLVGLEPQPAQERFGLARLTDLEVRLMLGSRPAWAAVEGVEVLGAGGLVHRMPGWPLAWLVLGRLPPRQCARLRGAIRVWLTGCPYRRVEAELDPGYPEHARFAASLGFEREGLRRQASADGRDLEAWAWLRPAG
jgi:hypothetical protein